MWALVNSVGKDYLCAMVVPAMAQSGLRHAKKTTPKSYEL